MALQRIETAYGNPIMFNGNIWPIADANVWLGNASFRFANVSSKSIEVIEVFTSNIVSAANTQAYSSNTGAYRLTGGMSITSGNVYISGSAGNAIVTTNTIQSGSIIPLGNAASNVSLGGSSNYWNNLYARNAFFDDIVVGGGISTFTSNINIAGNIIPTGANVTYNLGNVTQWWGTFYGISTQARYADLAENYQADAAYESGTVLEFGGTAEVTLAEDGTRRVAGVVSTNPAHLMNGGLVGTNVVTLALLGRVPCKVRGSIRKGDMLVSGGSGFARPENSPQLGAVIGKALEDFNDTEGVIEVVVGRI